MADIELTETQAAEAMAGHLTEVAALREAIRTALNQAALDQAARVGHPIHPEIFAGLLLHEVGHMAVQWGATSNLRPDDIAEYFDGLLRRARRGFRLQLEQALQRGAEPQNRIVTP